LGVEGGVLTPPSNSGNSLSNENILVDNPIIYLLFSFLTYRELAVLLKKRYQKTPLK